MFKRQQVQRQAQAAQQHSEWCVASHNLYCLGYQLQVRARMLTNIVSIRSSQYTNK